MDELVTLLSGRRIGYGATLRVEGRPATREDIADLGAVRQVLRRAVATGVALLDTADSYGPHLSEALVAEALWPYPPHLVIASKGGVERDGAATRLAGRPDQLRAACEGSLRRLRVDALELYQLHWRDPEVPFLDQVGALAELHAAGKVRRVGLCNVRAAELAEATSVMPIAAVQNRFGVADQDHAALVDACAAQGIAFIAYGTLALLRHPESPATMAVAQVARRHEATPAQVALGWILQRAPNLIAVPGTLSLTHLAENLRVVRLTDEDMAMLTR